MDPAREPLAGGNLQRRPAAAAAARGGGAQEPPPRGQRAIHADVDPAPRPRPGMQKLAIAAIVVLACLQFLPATHFRDPSNPRGGWISVDGSRKPADSLDDVGTVDVFTWVTCLDLRTLAVLTNSTLTSSSQKQIKDKLNVATPEGNFLWSFHKELSPLLIGTTQISKKRYVYTSADSIIRGRIEDLAHLDLGSHAIAVAEDCSKRFGDYVSMDVLNAIQRTAAKSWVSTEPYDKDACLLDFDVLLVEPRKLEKNLVDAIMWWARAVNVANPRDQIRLAIALTFYGKHVKLPSNWGRANAHADILTYDGPKNVCSEDGRQHEQAGHGEIWQQFLHQKSEAILSA
ncbi:hypothetical protein PR202_ga13675 [Eleusine coracana subsp. coracana]|uniref:Hexosyltransferase n=1 Tax=Eleusine coracana subsp. coracana TaxID=191504 RepID=A0AAV5CFB6_ELECO|nr:hypothetical protein PR202_ga13675 [Eleusine coracana subsp. coracana]